MPCFGVVKGKKFAYFTDDHHGDGKIALLVKISGADEQAALIEMDADRYYRPAYFGDGWIGIRLDLGDTDCDAIGDWLRKSWLSIAPKRSEEHTSEPQSLMRLSSAVFCFTTPHHPARPPTMYAPIPISR